MIVKNYDEILASIQDLLAVSNLDTSEGSYTDTLIRAAVRAMADVYFAQQGLTSIAFIDETSGGYIDVMAEMYGLSRKDGSYATGTVTFGGNAGATVAAGTAVQTSSGLIFTTDEAVTIGSDGVATAAITANDVGTDYNVDAGDIKILVNTASVTVTTASATTGGTDGETDTALLSRLLAIWQTPATSGNAYQYESWALSIDGIGGAKIVPTWDGGGTVLVVLTDNDMEPVSDDLVETVADYIETVRPICVDVTVQSATAQSIDVAVTGLSIDATTTLEAVTAQFASLVADYCQSVALVSDTVVYLRITYLLFSIDGVTDATSIKVNNGTSNITLTAYEVPVCGEVTMTIA